MSHTVRAQNSWRKAHIAPATDSGQALPLALIALAAGFLLVTVFALALGIYVKISAASATDLLDYYAADAGVERALAPLVADPAAYPSPIVLTLTLNSRSVTVSVTPGASQTIPASGNTMTATVTTHVVTSAVAELTIKARAEARHIEGQAGASVRITAWKVGQ